jgi:hypothetical protein
MMHGETCRERYKLKSQEGTVRIEEATSLFKGRWTRSSEADERANRGQSGQGTIDPGSLRAAGRSEAKPTIAAVEGKPASTGKGAQGIWSAKLITMRS